MIKKYLRARRIKKIKEEVLTKRKWFENSVKEMKQIVDHANAMHKLTKENEA